MGGWQGIDTGKISALSTKIQSVDLEERPHEIKIFSRKNLFTLGSLPVSAVSNISKTKYEKEIIFSVVAVQSYFTPTKDEFIAHLSVAILLLA